MNFFSYILFCTALLAPAYAAEAASQLIDGWTLSQKHAVNGKQNVFICKNAIRVDNVELGYSLVADSTKGTVVVFNSKKNLRNTKPLNKFGHLLAKPFMYANSEIPAPSKWTKTGVIVVDKLKADRYRTEEAATFFAGSRVGGGFLPGKKHEATASYELCLTRDMHTVKALNKLISELQGTPDLDGIPTGLRTKYSDSKSVRVSLQTFEARPQKLDPNTWSVPAQCKETAKVADVTSGDSSLLEEIVGE